jgi:hypothetical protein
MDSEYNSLLATTKVTQIARCHEFKIAKLPVFIRSIAEIRKARFTTGPAKWLVRCGSGNLGDDQSGAHTQRSPDIVATRCRIRTDQTPPLRALRRCADDDQHRGWQRR